MLRSALPLAVCTALAAPAAAGAADRYVAKSGTDAGPNSCVAQAAPCLTIQRAINASSDGDVVHVGPGQFDESLSAASKRVVVRGAGSGAGAPDPAQHTIVRAPSGFGLRMFRGGGVENLRLEGGTSGAAGHALIASASGAGDALQYEVKNVVLVAGAVGSAQASALQSDDDGTGRSVNLTVTDSSLLARDSTDNAPDPIVSLAGDAVVASIARSRVRGRDSTNDVGVTASQGALATLLEATVGDDYTLSRGAGVDGDGMLSVIRSRVIGRGGGLFTAGDAVGEHASVLALDSIVGPLPPVEGTAIVSFNTGGSTAQWAVRQSTLLASDTSEGAIIGFAGNGAKIEGTFANTIVRSLPESDDPEVTAYGTTGGETAFTFAHSLFNRAKVLGIASATTPGTGTNVVGDPRFTSLDTADLRLAPGSPAIDAGDLALLLPGEVDFAGLPRNVDGNGDCKAAPDMGALELDGQAKPCPPPASPAAADQPAATRPKPQGPGGPFIPRAGKPRVIGLKVAATRRGTTATFTLNQAAPVTLTIQRERPGLRRGRSCAKPTKALRKRRARRCVRLQTVATQRTNGKAGPNTISSRKRLKKGRYRATLTADGGASPAVTKLTAR